MNITNEQRDQEYETASEIQKHLYASPASGNQLWKIAATHQLTDDKTYTEFVTAVGDVVLGFFNSIQLPQLLAERLNMDPKKALAITADVLDFLEPLTTGEVPAPAAPTANTTTPNPEKQPTSNQSASSLQAEIEKTEAALNSTPTLRTMAADMKSVQKESDTPTYTTTQEAILKEGKTSDEVRWGQV